MNFAEIARLEKEEMAEEMAGLGVDEASGMKMFYTGNTLSAERRLIHEPSLHCRRTWPSEFWRTWMTGIISPTDVMRRIPGLFRSTSSEFVTAACERQKGASA